MRSADHHVENEQQATFKTNDRRGSSSRKRQIWLSCSLRRGEERRGEERREEKRRGEERRGEERRGEERRAEEGREEYYLAKKYNNKMEYSPPIQ